MLIPKGWVYLVYKFKYCAHKISWNNVTSTIKLLCHMAPPTLVYSKSDIFSSYNDVLANPEKYQCHLKSITQHECTFKVSHDRLHPPEIICLPFKRIFQRCLYPTIIKENGKKKRVEKWTNIEITDQNSNRDLMIVPKYGKDVKDFLNADKELKRLVESEMNENS